MHFQTSLHLITKTKMSSSGTHSATSSSSELSLHRCHSSSSSHTSYSSNHSQTSTSSSASGHHINLNLKQKLHSWFRSTPRTKVPKIVIHPPDEHDVFVKPSIPRQDWRPSDDEQTLSFGVPERDGRGRLYGSDEGVWFPNGL